MARQPHRFDSAHALEAAREFDVEGGLLFLGGIRGARRLSLEGDDALGIEAGITAPEPAQVLHEQRRHHD